MANIDPRIKQMAEIPDFELRIRNLRAILQKLESKIPDKDLRRQLDIDGEKKALNTLESSFRAIRTAPSTVSATPAATPSAAMPKDYKKEYKTKLADQRNALKDLISDIKSIKRKLDESYANMGRKNSELEKETTDMTKRNKLSNLKEIAENLQKAVLAFKFDANLFDDLLKILDDVKTLLPSVTAVNIEKTNIERLGEAVKNAKLLEQVQQTKKALEALLSQYGEPERKEKKDFPILIINTAVLLGQVKLLIDKMDAAKNNLESAATSIEKLIRAMV